MSWRSLLGFDLAGRLSSWRRRYKRSRYVFDYSTVWCGVSEWHDGRATVSVSAYCDDPWVSGFDSRPLVSVYRSKNFASQVEADAHLESRNQESHPKTSEDEVLSQPHIPNHRKQSNCRRTHHN